MSQYPVPYSDNKSKFNKRIQDLEYQIGSLMSSSQRKKLIGQMEDERDAMLLKYQKHDLSAYRYMPPALTNSKYKTIEEFMLMETE